ncbi:MAG: prepilin-type N-terminal cleavage/methylation domain-containing protein, partial [Candidatus Omnitrophica bacterium]|nr:prepilin-type N-terminal cleavage/methylation domain-containing protein [Candidatus Omnitrophota bacterium]
MRIKEVGFTLIELIVVIAIIAILAAVVAPNAFKAVEKAKISGALSDFNSIKTAAMAFYSDIGVWPASCSTPTECAQVGFINQNASLTGWDGPYLEKWPQASKWNGIVAYINNANTSFFGSPGAGERYVNMTNVPFTAAQKIDIQIDGTF